jgi:hypothetical protein
MADPDAPIGYIYALHDPFTMERRYIGKAKDPEARYRKHLKPYYLRPDTYKNRWLRQVLAHGAKPVMVIMAEAYDGEDINRMERDFIRWLRPASRLTNGTDGGDGGATNTGRKMPRTGPSPMLGVKWRPDDPRREQLRSRQRGHAPMHATVRATEANKFLWRVTSPDGATFTVRGLADLCRRHGLSVSKMAAVGNGAPSRKQHKGWRCEKVAE